MRHSVVSGVLAADVVYGTSCVIRRRLVVWLVRVYGILSTQVGRPSGYMMSEKV